jgi:FtsH-binding integral membrane protein
MSAEIVDSPPAGARAAESSQVTSFVTKTFGWMMLGLLITAGVAALFAGTGKAVQLAQSPVLLFGLIIAELALVVGLTFGLKKMSAPMAIGAFALYAGLNGATLSLIFLAYTATSIAGVFLIAATMFGVMAAVGYVTKKDLTKLGPLLLMALIGIIIAMLVNAFLVKSAGLDLAISIIGVLVFVGLTAYDAQKIKQMAQQGMQGEMATKASIIGALMLYLDLINLLLFLLRIFGQRR